MTETTTTVAARDGVIFQEDILKSGAARIVLAIARIITGFYFLWAFLDKTFGLGFSTPPERSWLNGGTPAQGYLGGKVNPAEGEPGWFAGLMEFFLSWGFFADLIFMLGLLGIGIALILGAGLKIAAVSGVLLMFFMYLSALPLSGSNPIMDSHWFEAALLVIPAVTLSGDTWGVGKIWGRIVGNSWLR